MARNATAMLLGIALLACFAAPADAQRWKYPPGPPYRTCPDTLTVFDVQNTDTLAAPCHPATLDTVWGVKGIITGFDTRSTAYAVYIQTGGAWTGVNVFTGSTNYNASPYNLALGDQIAVYGTTQEFPNPNGETEIEGPDAVQGTNDIIIRKISSGNPLPAFFVGTTAQLNWIPAVSAATAEPREGCLVRINGPLKVARTALGLGLQGNNFLIVNPAAPTDSVMIDGFTLTNPAVGAPPVGTNIDFVQGILNQRTGAGVNSYRIQLRNGNDLSAAVPPNLVEAYPIEDSQLKLVFDRDLNLSDAEDESNYSLGSGINGSSVDVATLVGGSGNIVLLDITTVLTDGEAETITAQNIGSATCPTCLSSSQTLNFGNGVIPISMIQAPQPDSLNGAPCNDRSAFAGGGTAFGTRITTRGVAIQRYGSLYYIQEAAGARRGVSVFAPTVPLVNGHQYRIACRIQEFGGETEIVNTVDILDEGPAATPSAVVQPISVLNDQTCDATQSLTTGEDFEGVLVRVNKAVVVPFANPPTDPAPGGSFLIAQPATQPSDTILVSSLGGNYTFDADPGMVVNVTGVLHEDGTFRILPRGNSDIELTDLAGVGGQTFDFALSVKPNPGTAHRVSFTLPTKSAVELGVFDLSGRRVAVIASGTMEAGSHSTEWSGLGTDGKRVGAGVYFYRLEVGGNVRTMRAVKLN